MAEKNNKLKAVDMTNKHTYIGRSDDDFPSRLKDYVLVLTSDLVPGSMKPEENYATRALWFYNNCRKVDGFVQLDAGRVYDPPSRIAVHNISE